MMMMMMMMIINHFPFFHYFKYFFLCENDHTQTFKYQLFNDMTSKAIWMEG